MATIERLPVTDDDTDINSKRCYVPGYVIKDKCPKCGTECEKDLGSDYLSYPKLNRPCDAGMYCLNEECGADWTVPVIVRMSVELAQGATAGATYSDEYVADLRARWLAEVADLQRLRDEQAAEIERLRAIEAAAKKLVLLVSMLPQEGE